MKIAVLLSCMHQTDFSIIEKCNIQCDVVVVNQCDKEERHEFSFQNKQFRECHAVFISTKERGLSRSRNMALRNSNADICIISDDDMFYPDDLIDIVSSEYKKCISDVILFSLERKDSSKKYPNKRIANVGLKHILKTSSPQITFLREKIIDSSISFDERMGSGTGNGGGEEVKFLLDCQKHKFKINYTPTVLGTMMPSQGQWFNGFTKEYMYNLGWTSRRMLGNFLGYIYIWYQVITKYPKYRNYGSFLRMVILTHKGYLSKR